MELGPGLQGIFEKLTETISRGPSMAQVPKIIRMTNIRFILYSLFCCLRQYEIIQVN